jgi:hypothetical protein
MIPNVFEIAKEIQASLGITPYDTLNTWKLAYYENNFVTPISRNQPPAHAQYVFDQINAANAISLSPYDFSISAPQAYSNANYPTANTQVTITPAQLTGYTGELTVYYQRIDISQVLSSQSVLISPGAQAKNLSDIIDQINSGYGLDLQSTDYVDTPLPTTVVTSGSAAPVSVTISINPNSLKYTGTYNYLLNYVNNASALAQSPSTSSSRTLVVFSGLPLSNYTKTAQLFTLNNQVDTSFSLGINASNVSEFTVSSSFFEQTTKTLYLNGSFSLTFTNGTIQTTGTFSTLVVDAAGNIIQGLNSPVFDLPSGMSWSVSRYTGLYYANNPAATSASQSIIRYLPSGLLDNTFSTNITYTPASVFVQASGNIYTVSQPFTGPNPYNPQQTSQTLVRIDRLLPNGTLDASYQTTYISSSIVNNPVCLVRDILETQQGLFILVNELTGYDVGSNVPVVNSISLVPTGSNAGALGVWIPIIALQLTGAMLPSFSNQLNSYSGSAISVNPQMTNSVGLSLNYSSGKLSFWSYINNPVTAIASYCLLSFNLTGLPVYYSFTTYKNLPIYANLSVIKTYSDGSYVVSGLLQSVNMNGILSAQKTLVTTIAADGTVCAIAPMQTGTFPGYTVSVLADYSF